MTALHNALRQGRKHVEKRRQEQLCAALGVSRLEMRRQVRAITGRRITAQEREELALRLMRRRMLTAKHVFDAISLTVQAFAEGVRKFVSLVARTGKVTP